ncbi:MAG TPA: ABC transporter permease [Thermoplasmata archaeon]|nr:ABC transporter permease [Thermoplasmata archaeon]
MGSSESVTRSGRVLPAFGIIGWRWISRNPASAIVPVMLPFLFLYFLRIISPPEYFPLAVAGAMLYTTQNIGSWCLTDAAVNRIELRLQEIFVASPLGKIRYLIGVAVSNFIAAAPALVVQGVLLALVWPVPLWAWGVLAGCIFVIWILFSAIGIAISTRIKSQREIWPIGNLIFSVLGIVSPIYYPLSILPPAWQTVARFLPSTYAAELVHGSLGLPQVPASAETLALDAVLLVVSALIGIAIALVVYRWRER